jgi:hypothetical protein
VSREAPLAFRYKAWGVAYRDEISKLGIFEDALRKITMS